MGSNLTIQKYLSRDVVDELEVFPGTERKMEDDGRDHMDERETVS